MNTTGKNRGVKYCVTALIDLLGFSSHLEVGRNDLRTSIGQEAISRLQMLEDAIDLLESERESCHQEYPSSLTYKRLNDAIILTLDLPDFLMPSVGQSVREGISVNEISEFFDPESFTTLEDFASAYELKLSTDITGLMKFVGLVARMHAYINRRENSAYFPGAKTVIAAGYRTPFFRDETEDVLSSNFSFANAFLAAKDLHGAALFLDDSLAHLLYANQFSRNLLRFACYVGGPTKFDPFIDYEDLLYRTHAREKTKPVDITLFRMPFSFREMDPRPLAYLQVIPRLSKYLRGKESPKSEGLFLRAFEAIQNGPRIDQPDDLPVEYPLSSIRNDLEDYIGIFSELAETGHSPKKNLLRPI
jgi:hypothetical protein